MTEYQAVKYEGSHPMYNMVYDAIMDYAIECHEECVPFSIDDAQLVITWRKDVKWCEAISEAKMVIWDQRRYDIVSPEVNYFGRRLRFSRAYNKLVKELISRCK